MLAGELYIADDPELARLSLRPQLLAERFNSSSADEPQEHLRILTELLGAIGPETEIRPPFHCDYGSQISIGARTFINFGLMALDCAPERGRGGQPGKDLEEAGVVIPN
jgi:maltose O-acetyltransferase